MQLNLAPFDLSNFSNHYSLSAHKVSEKTTKRLLGGQGGGEAVNTQTPSNFPPQQCHKK